MKFLPLLIFILIPLPVRSQIWVEFYREKILDNGIWSEFSRDIDLQSITKRGEYFYVNVRYWRNSPGSKTISNDQSIYTTRISCKEQTIQVVGHNRSDHGEGVIYNRFPNGEWKWKFSNNYWITSSTGHKDLLLKQVCN